LRTGRDDRGGAPLAFDPVQHFDGDLDFTGDFPCVRLVAHHCSGGFLMLLTLVDDLLYHIPCGCLIFVAPQLSGGSEMDLA
jgi:hypothetical protein